MIFHHESIQDFLLQELKRRVRLNPRYSLRSFAHNLHLSPGALSEILRGQRTPSLRSIPNIAKAIGLNAVEGRHLLRLAQIAKTSKDKNLREFEQKMEPRPQQVLGDDLFSLISEWYHFAILNLVDCESFQWKSSWIANRLGISQIQAQMAMDLLLRIGLIVRQNGRYIGKNDHILSSSELPSAAIRSYHRQILEKAVLALETQSLAERDFCGSGFAVDIGHLPAIKRELNEFHDHLVTKYSKGNKTEVYFLEMALFRLTQRSKN